MNHMSRKAVQDMGESNKTVGAGKVRVTVIEHSHKLRIERRVEALKMQDSHSGIALGI